MTPKKVEKIIFAAAIFELQVRLVTQEGSKRIEKEA
jgi:hypothetical protein